MGYQSQEYLLIENRQPGSYDALLPRGGLAIWHIDEYKEMENNNNEGYPGQPGWPANNQHCKNIVFVPVSSILLVFLQLTDSFPKDRVALLQADGRYDLELGRNGGDFTDLFRYDFFGGVDHLYPSYNDPLLGPFPNTDSYSQGAIVKTGHFISGISGNLIDVDSNLQYNDSPIQLILFFSLSNWRRNDVLCTDIIPLPIQRGVL